MTGHLLGAAGAVESIASIPVSYTHLFRSIETMLLKFHGIDIGAGSFGLAEI